MHGRPAALANKLMSEKNTLSTESSGPLGEISQAPPAFEAFLDKQQTKIIVFAIILAIGAAVYVVNKGIVQSAEETAGSLLVKAEDISDLQGVVKNHEGTSAASSAQVLLADKQWQEGQQDDAVATLNAFIAGAKQHPALPKPSARRRFIRVCTTSARSAVAAITSCCTASGVLCECRSSAARNDAIIISSPPLRREFVNAARANEPVRARASRSNDGSGPTRPTVQR